MPQQSLNAASFTDGFGLIVSQPQVALDVVPEQRTDGTTRARRFRVRLPVSYRFPDQGSWHRGVTDNISHEGLSLETDQPAGDLTDVVSAGSPVHVAVELPDEPDPARRVVVLGKGTLSRTTSVVGAPKQARVAVQIQGQFAVRAL